MESGQAETNLELTADNTGFPDPYNRVISLLGLETKSTLDQRFTGMIDGMDVYQIKIQLDGLPAALLSQHNYKGMLQIENGTLTLLNLPFPLEVQNSEPIDLLSMEDILASVKKYTEQGDIPVGEEMASVSEISLEYYVDDTAQGITYRPVWVFRVPYYYESPRSPEDLFYIDAQTGALVRTLFGY